MTLVIAGGGIAPGYQGRTLVNAIIAADKIYVDTYTSPASDWLIEWARGIAGNRVLLASRRDLEDKSWKIIEEAKSRNILILVAGDPLIATTHKALIAEATRYNVRVKIIPGVSGVCASKSISLLDYYKFGRTITIPGPWRNVEAYSIIYYIAKNACIKLHTLALLDFYEGRQLQPSESARILLSLEEKLGVDFLGDTSILVIERAGMEDGRVTLYDSLSELAEDKRIMAVPSSLILPGSLSEIERDILEAVHHRDPGYGINAERACKAVNRIDSLV